MANKELYVPDEVSHVLRRDGEAIYRYEALHVPFAENTIIHLVRHIEEIPGGDEVPETKKAPDAVIYRRYEREIPGRLVHKEDGVAFYLFHEGEKGTIMMVETEKAGIGARSVSPVLPKPSNFLSFFAFSKRETNVFSNKTERRGWRFAPFVPFAKVGLSVIWEAAGKRTSTVIEEKIFSEDTDIEDFDFHSCISAYHPELRRGVFFTRKGNSPMVLYGEEGSIRVFPDTFGIVPSVEGDYVWRAESNTEKNTMCLEKIDLNTGETVDEIVMRNLPAYVLRSACHPSRITEDGKRIVLAEKIANSNYPEFYLLHERETGETAILSRERENYDSRYYVPGRYLEKTGVFRYPDISLAKGGEKYASDFLYVENGESKVVHFGEKEVLLLPYFNDGVETAFAEFAGERVSFAERICEGFYLTGQGNDLVLFDARKRTKRVIGAGKGELSGVTRVYPGPGGENHSSSVPYAEDGEPYYVSPKDIYDPSSLPRRIFYEIESGDTAYGAVIYRVPDKNAFGALLPDGLRVSPNAARHPSFLFETRGDEALVMDFCENESGALVLFSMRVDTRSGDMEAGDFVETGIPYDSSVTVVGEGAVSIGEILEDGKIRYAAAAFFDGKGKLRVEKTENVAFDDYETGKKKIYPMKSGPDACTIIYEKEKKTYELILNGESIDGPFGLMSPLEEIVRIPRKRRSILRNYRDTAINAEKRSPDVDNQSIKNR